MRSVSFGEQPPQEPSEQPPPGPSWECAGAMVYDLETKKILCSSKDEREPMLEYAGWRDYDQMGISVATAYSFATQRYRIFMDDNLDDLARMIRAHRFVIGFNNRAFDDPLLAAHEIEVRPEQSVDLLCAVWQSAGLPPKLSGTKSGGYGLDPLYRANCPGGVCKSIDGRDAPKLYQQRRYGQLIDYGLNDTQMTVELVMLALAQGTYINPKDPDGPVLPIRDFLPQELTQMMEWRQALLPPE